ncbi:hypothetical protein [Actinophytocola sp.]|uniref:hypothetical protein n=1 Tax=Actinophytocola sp. TaxID=1872138 RepID=UPI002ED00615
MTKVAMVALVLLALAGVAAVSGGTTTSQPSTITLADDETPPTPRDWHWRPAPTTIPGL